MSELRWIDGIENYFGPYYKVGERPDQPDRHIVQLSCTQAPGHLPQATVYYESGMVRKFFNVTMLEYTAKECRS